MTLTETLAEVLAAHISGDYTHLFYDDPGAIDPPVRCRCGWRGPGSHDMHVAEHLAPLIAVRVEAAKAGARDDLKRRIESLHPEMLGWCQGCAHETYPCRTLLALNPPEPKAAPSSGSPA